MLDIQIFAKNSKHSTKIDIHKYIKNLDSRKISVPLLLKCVKHETKKLFDNTEKRKRKPRRKCVLGLYAVCPYAI